MAVSLELDGVDHPLCEAWVLVGLDALGQVLAQPHNATQASPLAVLLGSEPGAH